ncbi:FAD-dependent monooxygenase [Muricoccus vinaceus]|uniref:FAD-dependent monooxygenase n=1 Tax=Muricoccus vinaceus TaxID=424704 RepID=A0ABV6IPZ4_9PROT
MFDTEVIIVGAGPVGLTLAIDLGRRGIRCTLVEQKPAPEFLPKMERCNARTMELYRRIGLAPRIRAAGLAANVPMDVFVVLSMVEPPLLHLPYPSVAEAQAQCAASDDGTQPAEAYQLISQYTLEPLLKSVAGDFPSVTLLYGHAFEAFTQDEQGVTATIRAPGGATRSIRAAFLAGCDGGSSAVRRQLNIRLRGEGNLLRLRQALYRCDELFARLPLGHGPGHGRHYHVADDRSSFLIMQDSTRHWTLHAVVDSDEAMRRQFEQVVAAPVAYEMLYCGEWRQNLLLADRYGEGRVFLAGDSAHLVIPTGGLGMNTGVGDAFDLSWKLAGTLRGWGGPNLLRSYEVERRQVGDRNIGASRYASLGRRKWRSQYRPEIRDATPAGQAARENLARVADVEQRKTNEMIGAELGYRYVDSPIIDNIPGGPEHLFREYHPTTWPGARLPHTWRADGSAVQDHIPDSGYALLRLGGTAADTASMQQAFRARGAPLSVIEVAEDAPRALYGHDLLLLRPDLHVVWRGDAPPADPAALAATATGF